MIVVDYGQDVGGIPYFVVRSESGTPLLHSAYSEGLQYLGPQGDQTPPNSPTGDPNRFDDLIVGSSGTLTTGPSRAASATSGSVSPPRAG